MKYTELQDKYINNKEVEFTEEISTFIVKIADYLQIEISKTIKGQIYIKNTTSDDLALKVIKDCITVAETNLEDRAKDKYYIVVLPNKTLEQEEIILCRKDNGYMWLAVDDRLSIEYDCRFTEKEIKAVNEFYFRFAEFVGEQ